MENVILIQVESIADLELNPNFIVLESSTGKIYRGNPLDATLPIEMTDGNNSTFANHFLLMGA